MSRHSRSSSSSVVVELETATPAQEEVVETPQIEYPDLTHLTRRNEPRLSDVGLDEKGQEEDDEKKATDIAPLGSNNQGPGSYANVYGSIEAGVLAEVEYLRTMPCLEFERKNKIAYFLWLLLGWVGGHHFYTRRYAHGLFHCAWVYLVSQTYSYYKLIVAAIPFVIWLIDFFRIKSFVTLANSPASVRSRTWSFYDIFQLWLPPFGIAGCHHWYMKNYWVASAYVFSAGFFLLGWIVDIVLLPCYFYREIRAAVRAYANRSETDENEEREITAICGSNPNETVANDGYPYWMSPSYHKKSYCQIFANWFPFNGFLGLHHLYVGDIWLAICYFFTFGLWGVGWLVDFFRLQSLVRKYDPSHKYAKTLLNSYLTWFGSIGFLGCHHLYLQNYVMFIGHILTLGGCGLMWLYDLFHLSSFVRYSNIKLHTTPASEAQNGPTAQAEMTDEELMKMKHYRILYTTYLFWMPLMGFIGVYYLYLGKYKQFILRFFTMNFLFVGWVIDAFRIPSMVKEKVARNQLADEQSMAFLD